MTGTKRTRLDPRREATRTALIEAAESLFAEVDIGGVSTRQIGAAIGSANANVVAYHFGGKEALIHAIYRHRLPAIDHRRGQLLDEAENREEPGISLTSLIRIIFQPLFEQTDARGRHSYARFLAGVERSGMIATRGALQSEFPETERLTALLRDTVPRDTAPLLDLRMRLVAGLFSNALMQIDRDAADDPALARRQFDNAVMMASAAMAAPAADHCDFSDRPASGHRRGSAKDET